MQRRTLLFAATVALTGGLAGCAGPAEDSSPTEEEDDASEGRDGIY